jgi:hypothetical protein
MTVRVLCLILSTALAWGVACGNEGAASAPTADARDAAVSEPRDASAPDAPSGSVAITYAAAGPSAVSTCEVAAASSACTATAADASAASALYVVFYPADLGPAGALHPILTWGNGTGATPDQYSVRLSHLASWGFVVIASTSPSTGTGQEMLAAEDYLAQASADAQSPFRGRLDLDHVGALGHSQGTDGAAHALLAADAPGSAHRFITTIVLIEPPAQKWICFGSSDPSCPAAESFDSKSLAHGSVFFVDGSQDTLIAPPTQASGTAGEQSVQAYYDATPAPTPKAKGTLVGADHSDIQDHCAVGFGCAGVGPSGYLGYITAWLMYQLRGDAQARMAFAGTAPQIDRDPAWSDVEQANVP